MGVSAIFQLYAPWTEDQLPDVGYDQAADAMIFTHLNHQPWQLLRYGHADWTLTQVVFGAEIGQPTGLTVTPATPETGTGYYPKSNVYTVTAVNDDTGVEGVPSTSAGATNDLTLHGNYNLVTWGAVAGATSYNIYKGEISSLGFVGRAEGTSFRDDNILPDYSDSYPRHRDPFVGPNGYPAVVTFYQQRAIFARTLEAPAGVFASRSADLFNFNSSLPSQADDAITFSVAARRVNAVLHLVPLKALIAFTTDSVFSIDGGGEGGYLSPTNINVTPEGYRGVSRVRPVAVDDVVFYNTARGNAVRTLNYQFERDGYKGNDITVFARHFFRGHTLVDMAWAEEPTKTVWCIRDDGKMLALTWMEEQDVWGWTLCETQGLFESCCVVSEDGQDVLYVIVRRYIRGVWVRHIERLMSPDWPDIAHAIYLDAARTYDGPPTKTVTGLDYLEGSTVNVLADGGAVLGLVVAGGKITLPAPASVITVGLPYEAWIKTLPVSVDASGRVSRGRAKEIAEVQVHVERTRGVEMALGKPPRLGPDGPIEPTEAADEARTFYSPRTRTMQTALSAHPDLYSGPLVVDMEAGDWTERGAVVVVRQRYPLPFFVAGITAEDEYGG